MSGTPRYSPGAPERPAFYRFARILVNIVSPLIYKLDIQGTENIPAEGGVLFASNHLSSYDILSVAQQLRRIVHFMAKSEYQENRLLRWLFTSLEGFFVRRGEADIDAIRNCQAILKAGQILLIYPEGHRSDSHALIPAHDGFALIAFRTGTPVVPVATWGSELVFKQGLFRRPTIHVRYSKPIYFVHAGKKATRDELQAATEQTMYTIAGLLPPAYQGVYSDVQEKFPAALVTDASLATTTQTNEQS